MKKEEDGRTDDKSTEDKGIKDKGTKDKKIITTDAQLQTIIERVKQMEQYMDEVRNAVKNGVNAITDDNDIKEKITILTQYYEGGQWLQDYDCDDLGELPEDLKRGVLSQDGLYDLLQKVDVQN